MKIFKIVRSASVLALSAVAGVSCVNEDYNLGKPIDLTVNVEGDIALPLVKNTEFITIGDLLKDDALAENIVLVPYDGSQEPAAPDSKGYYMLKVDGTEPVRASFGTLDLDIDDAIKDLAEPFTEEKVLGATTAVDLRNVAPGAEAVLNAAGLSAEIDVIGRTPAEIKLAIAAAKKALADASLAFDESKIVYPKQSLFINGIGDRAMLIEIDVPVPPVVRDVRQLTLDADMIINIGPDINELTIREGFVVEFPQELTIEAGAAADGWEVKDGHILRFTRDFDVSSGSKLMVKIKKIKGVSLQEGVDGRRLKFDGTVDVTGNTEWNVEKILAEPSMQNTPILKNLTFKTVISFDSIVPGEAEVKLDLDAALRDAGGIEDQEIILGSFLPENISRDDIVLDLYNPVILLSVQNDSPVDASLNAVVNGFDADGKPVPGGQADLSGKIRVRANTSPAEQPAVQQFALSRRELTSGSLAQGVNVVVPELGALLAGLPEKLTVSDIGLQAEGDDYITVDLAAYSAKELAFDCSYGVRVPLAFGEDFRIKYALNRIEDLNSYFSQDAGNEDGEENNTKIDLRELYLDLDIANSLPIALGLEVMPVDIDGNVMGDDIRIEITYTNESGVQEVLSGKPDGLDMKAADTRVSVVIVPESPEALETLDALDIFIAGNAGQAAGVALSNAHGFRVTNARARIVGGVAIDNGTVNLFE